MIDTIDGELMEGDIVWGRIVEVLKNNPGYYSYPLMEMYVEVECSYMYSGTSQSLQRTPLF